MYGKYILYPMDLDTPEIPAITRVTFVFKSIFCKALRCNTSIPASDYIIDNYLQNKTILLRLCIN